MASGMEVCKAHNPVLDKRQGASSALRGMIVSCLQHLQTNVPGAVHRLGEEYLHQVRVALRRLRVALGMAETFCADAELGFLHQVVTALCTELGRAREWDVFVTQTLAPVCAHLPEHAGLGDALRASEALREQHQNRVRELLHSQDYQRFLLRFGAWLHGEYWREPRGNGTSLPGFSAQILGRRSKQVAKRGRDAAAFFRSRAASGSAAQAASLHALRIACKKLRYSAELFSSLYGGAGARRYLSALAPLQDILGALNDIAVARRLLGEIAAPARRDADALVRGWIEHEHAQRLSELREAWEKFSGQKKFWQTGKQR
jgi:CHAD domain-containing protein